jgi:hypothetical protein
MSPLFVSGSTSSGARQLTGQLGLSSELSPIYNADFVAKLLWIFMVNTGEDRRTLLVRCMSDTLRATEAATRDGDWNATTRPLLLERDDVSHRTRILLDQLDCGLGPLALREFVGGLFDAHCTRDGKPNWVCSSALLAHMMPQIQSLFPDMRMVHVLKPKETIFPMAQTFQQRFPGQYRRIDGSQLDTAGPDVVRRIISWASAETHRPAGACPRAA